MRFMWTVRPALTVTARKNSSASAVSIVPHMGAAAREYLALLVEGKQDAARKYASLHGCMEDELVDEINEISMERIGDIALEMDEGGYSVIPDYLDEVTKWML